MFSSFASRKKGRDSPSISCVGCGCRLFNQSYACLTSTSPPANDSDCGHALCFSCFVTALVERDPIDGPISCPSDGCVFNSRSWLSHQYAIKKHKEPTRQSLPEPIRHTPNAIEQPIEHFVSQSHEYRRGRGLITLSVASPLDPSKTCTYSAILREDAVPKLEQKENTTTFVASDLIRTAKGGGNRGSSLKNAISDLMVSSHVGSVIVDFLCSIGLSRHRKNLAVSSDKAVKATLDKGWKPKGRGYGVLQGPYDNMGFRKRTGYNLYPTLLQTGKGLQSVHFGHVTQDIRPLHVQLFANLAKHATISPADGTAGAGVATVLDVRCPRICSHTLEASQGDAETGSNDEHVPGRCFRAS
eukprot:scaffold195_cov95-Cyclotella_meneghiniana.AAC.10